MNALQTCEFNILKEIYRVCDVLGIKCFLVCGSALGAVKYSGFIPWDDDIDVGMFREDYEIFISNAQSLLPDFYFLQNHVTEKAYPFIYSKLRDSRTTYIDKNVAHLNINHGVYVDVFPLDGYPVNEDEIQKLEKRKRWYKIRTESVVSYKRSKKLELFNKLLLLFGEGRRVQRTLNSYENMISSYPVEGSQLICNHGNWQGRLEYSPAEHYGDGVKAEFEGLDVIVPKEYDKYLTQKYSDWRADLPKELQKGHHYYEIMDLESPYTEYTEKISDTKIRIKKQILHDLS